MEELLQRIEDVRDEYVHPLADNVVHLCLHSMAGFADSNHGFDLGDLRLSIHHAEIATPEFALELIGWYPASHLSTTLTSTMTSCLSTLPPRLSVRSVVISAKCTSLLQLER